MSDELKRPGWELMRREADSSGKKYLFHFQHEDGREIAIEGRVENEAWFYLGLNTRAQPSDGALTNEGAEPVAWMDPRSPELHATISNEVKQHNIKFGSAPAGAVSGYSIPLYRHPPKVCTCLDRVKELNS